MIGKYKRLGHIADGATSDVFLCESPDGVKYAAKVLNQRIINSGNDSIIEMFVREIELSDCLRHPNIVSMVESNISDEIVYSITEYANGGSMEKYCHQSSLLPLDSAMKRVFQIIKAMDFASSKGVVHCDLKPRNILLFDDGVCKVSDFGASIYASDFMLSNAYGSPAYMSPEQITGEPVSTLSDIYSFGVLLYQLTTGRLPYLALSPSDAKHQALHAKASHPKLFRIEMPDTLDAIIWKCIQRKPQDRYQSWIEIGKDILAVIDELSISSVVWTDRSLIVEAIKEFPFFKSFSTEQIWELIMACKIITIRDRQRVIHHGDRSQIIYLIIDGEAIVTVGKKSYSLLKSGSIFGEAAYLSQDPAFAMDADVDVVASTLMMIDPVVIDGMTLEARLAIMTGLARSISNRPTRVVSQ